MLDDQNGTGTWHNVTASNMQLIAGITYDIRATFGGETMYLYVNGTLIGTNTYYLGVQSGSENYVGMGWINSMVPCGASGDYNDFQYSSTLQTYGIANPVVYSSLQGNFIDSANNYPCYTNSTAFDSANPITGAHSLSANAYTQAFWYNYPKNYTAGTYEVLYRPSATALYDAANVSDGGGVAGYYIMGDAKMNGEDQPFSSLVSIVIDQRHLLVRFRAG